MKQVTVVFHYDDDQSAQELYEELKDMQRNPHRLADWLLDLEGSEIRDLKIKGPND